MSHFIKLKQISFAFDNLNKELFSGLSGSFHEGWTSICGPNGCGKTTLLRLISGELKPKSGSIECYGTPTIVLQNTHEKPSQLEEFRYDYSRSAIKIREDLGIEEDWYDRWDSLSIGERKRLQIARALWTRPYVLLVDEPSNHLDASTKKIILKSLQKFSGVGILISHDRLLLNDLCSSTAFLEEGELRSYSIPYDKAKEELENSFKLLVSQKDILKKEKNKVSKTIQMQLDKIAKGKKSLSKRNISSKDHDAKDKINLAKVTGAGLADSRKKKVLSGQENKLSDKITNLKTKKTYKLGIFFEDLPRVRPLIFPKYTHELSYLTIKQPEIYLSAGDKLAITGDNGAGKSTLLKSLVKTIATDYVFASQELSEEEVQKLTKNLDSLDKEQRGKLFTLISAFGSSPKSINAGSLPSPGVWQKILIAWAILKSTRLLILDEPTNHMDLDATEVLEEALKEYQGILIFISHDAALINNIATLKLHLVKDSGLSEGILKIL